MKSEMKAVLLAVLAAAFLDTALAAMPRFSGPLSPVILYAGFALILYSVVVPVAALLIRPLPRSIPFLRQALFLTLVAAPSVYSPVSFFLTVSGYQVGRTALVEGGKVTDAGMQYLALEIGQALLAASAVTLVYFLWSDGGRKRTVEQGAAP